MVLIETNSLAMVLRVQFSEQWFKKRNHREGILLTLKLTKVLLETNSSAMVFK
jgi:hypothetical protein